MTSDGRLPFINPATSEQFGSVRMASPDDVRTAVCAMREAATIWRRKPVSERIRVLRQLQKEIIDKVDEISAVINKDTGKSRQDALIEIVMTVDKLHQYYKHAPSWLERQRVPPGLYPFRRYYAERQPYGVVAVIGPWNYPFDLTVPIVCSALLAGNTVVLKPSEVAPATGEMIEKLLLGIPELSPFVRVLHGDAGVGAELVASGPDLIFLTGSTRTGYKVAQAAAATMTPYIFELGGKDPMIVLEDADLDAAARWGTWGAFYNTGQTCMAIERVYVVESVYDPFVEKVLAETDKLTLGYSDAFDSDYDLGPLTFEGQLHIIQDHMQDATDKGATILRGGTHEGMFVAPTVIVDVDHSMNLMREETFGPVMPIMKVKDEADAIRFANDSDYGLSAAVWSQDLDRAQRVARELEVGSVNINDAISHYPVSLLPFGGVKKSGTARTHGKEEVLQFTQLRSYAIGNPPLSLDIATRMRQPGNYRLGKAIIHFAFGETPRQRVQPIVDEAARLAHRAQQAPVGVAATVGLAAGIAAVAFNLFRDRD